ncbi:MAG: FecCD family ABC transporter permease [Candidatus Limnocylindria bacterium]
MTVVAPSAERAGATRPPVAAVLGALGVALVAAVAVAVTLGAVAIPLDRVLATLAGRGEPTESAIVLSLRLPRVLGAALVGAALAVAGTLLQGLLRNPLADPYVLGTSAGASVAGTVGLLVAGPLGYLVVPAFAFAGALGSTAFVWRVARVGAHVPIVSLLLAGVVLSAVAGSVVALLLVMSDRLQLRLAAVLGWLMGGVSVVSWEQLGVAAALGAVSVTLGLATASRLDALALGEDAAASLGVDVERPKRVILVASALLTATAVSLAGLVGFVGLVVPHAARLVVGPRHARLLPACALGGATFVVLADLLARVALAPAELPVGVISGLVGGPFFFALLWRQRDSYRL